MPRQAVEIRHIEQADMIPLLEAERASNLVHVKDEDFGEFDALNPWAMSADDVLTVIRKRRDSERGTFDTRTFVKDILKTHQRKEEEMSRRPAPTEKQAALLDYIIAFVEAHGYQPSQGEMAGHFGVSKNAIHERLRALARKGVIGLAAGRKVRERAVALGRVTFTANPPGPASESI